MKTRIAVLALSLVLSCAVFGKISAGLAALAQTAPGARGPGASPQTSLPNPQPRYKESRPVPDSANTQPAAPRPPQEPYLRDGFDRLLSYLPDLVAGLLVLAAGILIAYLLRFVLLRVLPRAGFDAFLMRNGLIGSGQSASSSQRKPEGAAFTEQYATPEDERASARNSELYRSYFGRPPARRWQPEENVAYRPPNFDWNAENVSPSQEDAVLPNPGSAPNEDIFAQRLAGSPLNEASAPHEQMHESDSEISSPDADHGEHASVSADVQKFLEQEQFNPEPHQPVATVEESRAPEEVPRLRRAEDLFRPRMGTRLVANAVFWIIVIAALMEACQAARLYGFASGLDDVLSYVPHLIAAVLIFVVSILVANWVCDRVVGGDASTSALVGGAVKAGILTIGGFMALRELQIAPDIVKIAFTLAFGAIALATALAFGLGSRKVAEQMTSEIYDQSSSKLREFARRSDKDAGRAA